MRFKTLEIQGFKSFPDKTTLTFDSRTTAVVGSNGNGKSNISDALRWVMGEQGAKVLRGAAMEDVIFHGTQTRKAMGFATVTLTIDNTDGHLPVAAVITEESGAPELSAANEVVITRKLYRTGDSEYLINGRKSRLKDINTLFMGTGLGRDGYSIIGQGRIDEIVNSKAAGRREIFEEAAGVSKFLFKKGNAQRELDRTDENLLRLLDIETELQERLPRLEKQAEKANKAFALKEEERALGVAVSVRELEWIGKDTEKANNDILKNQGECEHFEREIAELEAEVETVLAAKQDVAAQTARLRGQNESAQKDIADCDTAVAVMKTEITHNDGRVSAIREQIALSEKSGEELLRQVGELNAQIGEKQMEIAQTEESITAQTQSLNELGSRENALDSENAARAREIAELYTAKSAAEIYINRANAAIEELQEQLTQAETLISGQADEKQRLVLNRDELRRQLDELLEERDETSNKLSGYSRLYEGKAAKADEARERLEGMKSEHHKCRTRLDVLGDVERSMAGYHHSVKSVMQAAKSGRFNNNDVLGIVADVIKVDDKYATAVEIALGGALQNVIVANENVAKRCMAFLKDNKAGRATFLPLTSYNGNALNLTLFGGVEDMDGYIGLGSEIVGHEPRFEGIIRALLGRCVFAEDIDAATVIAKRYGFKFKIVTLDGQVVNAGGSFTGGSVKKSEGIISRKQELEGLQKRADKLAEELEPMKIQSDRLAAECAKMKLECEGMNERLAKFSGDEMRLNAELDGVVSMLNSFEEQLAQSGANRERFESRIAEERAIVQENTATAESAAVELAEKEQTATVKDQLLEELVNERREGNERITQLNLQKLMKSKDIEHLTSQIANLERTRLEAGENRSEHLREIDALNDKSATLRDDIAAKQAQAAVMQRDLGGYKLQVDELIRAGEEHEKRSAQIHGEIREKLGHKEKFANALSAAYERKNNLERDGEKIKSKLFDDYELTPTEAFEFAAKVAAGTDGFAGSGGLSVESDSETAERNVIKQANAALAEIRKQLAALGDVNYAAITEFDEVSARYKELSGQLSDVRKAKRELEKLIEELTGEIRTRFLESFNDISVHFSRIFTEIFGGGTARLELVNPQTYETADDVLTAGIEIFAAPPGKLSKSLMALSGGEKALVAITLYMAILLHRPTPFCMLDEVDAALDEVNVVKYINYLKRYADSTQLMMITHRRSTIEGCDVLYGVFMQEKGVSRLLKQTVGE